MKASVSASSSIESKRPKERTIAHILETVHKWRKYYHGYTDHRGNYKKLKLQQAAAKVKMPKKSLDDYLLQIRMAAKLGFDFSENGHKKVGVLRTFVKKERVRQNVSKKQFKKMPLRCHGLDPDFARLLTGKKPLKGTF